MKTFRVRFAGNFLMKALDEDDAQVRVENDPRYEVVVDAPADCVVQILGVEEVTDEV